MIREVDLLNYLPLFMQDFKEIAVTLEAENPEFVLVWTAADQVLKNEFIATADAYGISRFESMLGILSYDEDTLESRRARVAARWFNSIPYTLKALLAKLTTVCGDTDFVLTNDFETGYTLTLITDLENFGQVEELEEVLESWLPANINYVSLNQIPCDAEGNAYCTGGICFVHKFLITNDFQEDSTINGNAVFGGGMIHAARYFITNDSEENITASGDALTSGGAVNTATVIITNDFNETFDITGEAINGSGVVFGEVVGIPNE